MKPTRFFALSLSLGVFVLINGCGGSGSGSGGGGNNTPTPAISSISPTSLSAGSSSQTITVMGSGFLSSSVIEVGGVSETTAYVSSTELTATTDQSSGQQSFVNHRVGTSTAASVAINNPPIGDIQLTPSTLIAGTTTPTTLTVTGNTFFPGTVIQVNGTARTTTYVNATTLTFVATVADQATAATLLVTATNPAPGGGISAVANLTVSAPTPTPVISSVSPNSFIAGSAETSINIVGTSFTSSSIVDWNGSPLVTSLYYGGELTATVPEADLTTAGTASVTVNTPTATPSLSNAVTVSITNPPAPTLTSIYPTAGPINTATSLTMNGTGFTALTTAAVNGQTSACTFVSSTQLTCLIPASSLALPGNVNVTLTTPAPGGGTTATLLYTAYVAVVNNDLVYNSVDGLLYVSVPPTGIGTGGNTVTSIDPVTEGIRKQRNPGPTYGLRDCIRC
jgi:trimeric autotransporter adhesin